MSTSVPYCRRLFLSLAIPFVFSLTLCAGLLSSRSSQAVPGQECTNDPSICDVCNSEVCVNINPTNGFLFCAIPLIGGGFNTDPAAEEPACPGLNQPGCYTTCTEVAGPIGGPAEVASCSASDDFCNGISGGNSSNECRTAVCDPQGTGDQDPMNVSGCDYSAISDEDLGCLLCASPAPSSFDSCGNGICEQDEGETFDNCSIDCRVPGFVGPLLMEGDLPLDLACGLKPITFNGPPYNVVDSELCEDGDVCTNNTCDANINNVCIVDPKGCSMDVADFCCASGCNPPVPNGVCGSDDNCDVDCYIPQDCIPTPTPIGTTLLEGSGCSLNASAASQASSSMVLLLTAGGGMLGGLWLRRRTR